MELEPWQYTGTCPCRRRIHCQCGRNETTGHFGRAWRSQFAPTRHGSAEVGGWSGPSCMRSSLMGFVSMKFRFRSVPVQIHSRGEDLFIHSNFIYFVVHYFQPKKGFCLFWSSSRVNIALVHDQKTDFVKLVLYTINQSSLTLNVKVGGSEHQPARTIADLPH